MNPAEIINAAEQDGVRLALSAAGTLKASGDEVRIAYWLPVIRDNKAGIVALLSGYTDAQEAAIAANDNLRAFAWAIHYADRDPVIVSFSPEATHGEVLAAYPDAVAAEPASDGGIPPSTHLSAGEESSLQKWLASIGETDAPTIAEMLRQCRTDAEARGYFLDRAGVLRSTEPGDDRVRCVECRNHTHSGICTIARPGGGLIDRIVTSKGYHPAMADALQHCQGYISKGSTK